MEQQFRGYGDWGSDAGQGTRFAHEIQQAMGEDFELDPQVLDAQFLDAQFLEESWTVGVAAATESWRGGSGARPSASDKAARSARWTAWEG